MVLPILKVWLSDAAALFALTDIKLILTLEFWFTFEYGVFSNKLSLDAPAASDMFLPKVGML
jgi:hypothetical protein